MGRARLSYDRACLQVRRLGQNGLRTAPSSICDGCGLFVDHNVSAGAYITYYDGVLFDRQSLNQWLSRDSGRTLPPELHLSHARTLHAQQADIWAPLDAKLALEWQLGGGGYCNDGGYLQSESLTNAHLVGVSKGINKMIVVQAISDIAAGQEVFVSYGKGYWK